MWSGRRSAAFTSLRKSVIELFTETHSRLQFFASHCYISVYILHYQSTALLMFTDIFVFNFIVVQSFISVVLASQYFALELLPLLPKKVDLIFFYE